MAWLEQLRLKSVREEKLIFFLSREAFDTQIGALALLRNRTAKEQYLRDNLPAIYVAMLQK